MIRQKSHLVVLSCLLCLSAVDSPQAEEEGVQSRNCISTRSLKSTYVIDDLNILFVKTGNSYYHNVLPKQCTGLSRTRAFSYATLSGSLCSFDTIRVLDESGGDGKSCRIGVFYPIEREDIPGIVNGAGGRPAPAPLPSAEPEDVIVESDKSEESTSN